MPTENTIRSVYVIRSVSSNLYVGHVRKDVIDWVMKPEVALPLFNFALAEKILTEELASQRLLPGVYKIERVYIVENK
jgi:hypothetical protein